MPRLEASIERAWLRWMRQKHPEVSSMKPDWRAWPDRIVFAPGPRVFMIEFKRPGEKPRRLQEYTHDALRKMGFKIYVTDNVQEAKEITEKELSS